MTDRLCFVGSLCVISIRHRSSVDLTLDDNNSSRAGASHDPPDSVSEHHSNSNSNTTNNTNSSHSGGVPYRLRLCRSDASSSSSSSSKGTITTTTVTTTTTTRRTKLAALLATVVLAAIFGLRSSTHRLETVTQTPPGDTTAKKPNATTVPTKQPPQQPPPPPRFVPPSKMQEHYYQMWDHDTSTIDVPQQYQTPFDEWVIDEDSGAKRRPRTSLEILQEVLHGPKYRADFDALEAYLNYTRWTKNHNNNNENQTEKPTTIDPPRCLVPDTRSTQKLADQVVRARQQRIEQQQQPQHPSNHTLEGERDDWQWPHDELILSLPIINVGFPKSGTTTLHKYFQCIGLMSDHSKQVRNKFSNTKHLHRIQKLRYHVYNQIDRIDSGIPSFPQITKLDELHEYYPSSTMVFLHRPVADWIRSVSGWKEMRSRLDTVKMPGLQRDPEQLAKIEAGEAPLPLTDLQLARWWCGHVLHVREYVKEYPSHALVELDLYDVEGTSDLLFDLFRADTEAHHHHHPHRNRHHKSPSATAAGNRTDGGEPPPRPCWGQRNKSDKYEGLSDEEVQAKKNRHKQLSKRRARRRKKKAKKKADAQAETPPT